MTLDDEGSGGCDRASRVGCCADVGTLFRASDTSETNDTILSEQLSVVCERLVVSSEVKQMVKTLNCQRETGFLPGPLNRR